MKIKKLFKETNKIQRIISLRNSRNSRYRYQEFILEGRIALEQAYEMGWKVKSLFYNNGFPLSDWAKNYLHQANCDVVYQLPSFLMDLITDKAQSAEMIGIAEMQIRPLTSYQPSSPGVIVVLDSPKSAGNVGMMIRSSVAFGAQAIIISGCAADEYDPKCIRASVGTFFSIPIYRVEGINKFIKKTNELKKQKNLSIIASGDRADNSLDKACFKSDLIFLVLGNETSGVSSGYRHIANEFVRIPLTGKFTSLNLAAAGSIFLYEIFCRRH